MIVTPEASRIEDTIAWPSTSSGMRMAVTTAELSASGEKSSSPIALTPARAARPRRTCRSWAVSRPSARIMSSATSRPRTSEIAVENGVSPFAWAPIARCQSM